MEIRLQAEDKVYTTGETISGKVLVKQTVLCEQLRVSIVLIGKTLLSQSLEPSQADDLHRENADSGDQVDSDSQQWQQGGL